MADGVVYVTSDRSRMYALKAGASEYDSSGSRTLLGTIGHHKRLVSTDPAGVKIPGNQNRGSNEEKSAGKKK